LNWALSQELGEALFNYQENGMKTSYLLYDGKVIIRIKDRICDTPDELVQSELFREVICRFVSQLQKQRSRLLSVFPDKENITDENIQLLLHTFRYLTKLPADDVSRLVIGSESVLSDRLLLNDFVEQFYNYWRSLHRLIVCDSVGDRFDRRPYRTFNEIVESLMHVVRSTYRDIQENLTGNHPRIYRQVSAGAEVAAIARPRNIRYPAEYRFLNNIAVTSQVLIYPPMIFNSPTNKRSGMFEGVSYNPLENIQLDPSDWIGYPAKVGPLLIMIYFSMKFFELGFSLCNLFELATEEDLKRTPDAVFLYGTPIDAKGKPETNETVFFDDETNQILVASVPFRDEYGYFGYLKKMALTLHNIIMLKRGRLPYHGAMFRIAIRDIGVSTFVVIGDTGAGKSETLEAFRALAKDEVEDLTIVADDMGSLEIGPQGEIIGFGTEMGAFVRLDDLQSGYALGQIDRAIIMNADQVNARVVLPVTKYDDVIKGYPVDFVLYANNYQVIDGDHTIIHRFTSVDEALDVFRAGAVMSKGTTTSTGLVKSFYANIFGPAQYPDLQEKLARSYYNAMFEKGLFVGELRTQLAIPGMEHKGPELAAKELLKTIQSRGKQ
jgi:hypothetical protein